MSYPTLKNGSYATAKQIGFIKALLAQVENGEEALGEAQSYRYTGDFDELSMSEASTVIDALLAMRDGEDVQAARKAEWEKKEAERKALREAQRSEAYGVDESEPISEKNIKRLTRYFAVRLDQRKRGKLRDAVGNELAAKLLNSLTREETINSLTEVVAIKIWESRK